LRTLKRNLNDGAQCYKLSLWTISDMWKD
jgi:hypothetical protein